MGRKTSDDVRRRKGKDKMQERFDRNGKHSSKHVRQTLQKYENRKHKLTYTEPQCEKTINK